MSRRIEVLLATMNQKDFSIVEKMNIKTPAIIANQYDKNIYEEKEIDNNLIRMYTTDTRGVGINRNLGLLFAKEDILLFSDDDMVYYDDYEEKINNAFNQLPKADVIIFSMNMKSKSKRKLHKTKRIHLWNAFRHGTCTIAIKKSAVEKCNLKFSTLFGGGAIYSCGEDSLFIMDCLKNKLVMYSHESIIGINMENESTWFKGYNEKYFYDKGAWLACIPGKYRFIMKIYLSIRLGKFTNIGFIKRLTLINKGIKSFPKDYDIE